MNRDALLKEMRDSIGTQNPTVFFGKMVDVFMLMFDHIEKIEADNIQLKKLIPLAIQWDPKVASDMLAKQIQVLKEADETLYADEIQKLRTAYGHGMVTHEYQDFCRFWQDTLGYHPFLNYDR